LRLTLITVNERFTGVWFQLNSDAHYLLDLMSNLQSTYNDTDQYTVYCPVKGRTSSYVISDHASQPHYL